MIGDILLGLSLLLLFIILCDMLAEAMAVWEDRQRRKRERIEQERWLK